MSTLALRTELRSYSAGSPRCLKVVVAVVVVVVAMVVAAAAVVAGGLLVLVVVVVVVVVCCSSSSRRRSKGETGKDHRTRRRVRGNRPQQRKHPCCC